MIILLPKKHIEVVHALPAPRLRGHFTVERFRGDHRFGIKTGHWEFENNITNAGLNALGANVQIVQLLSHMGVGTGSTAPADTDTSLVAEISPTNTNRSNDNGSIADVFASGASFVYWSWKRVRLFVEAQANGNLTEVGWFTANTGGTMWTRQLFKDGGGSPTTIVKTSSDQLRVTYELRLYPPTVDVTGTVTITGNNYDYTIRAAEIDLQVNWGADAGGNGMLSSMGSQVLMQMGYVRETSTLGTTQQTPAGSNTVRDSASLASYTTGNFYRDATLVWEPGSANFATGVGSCTFWHGNNGSTGHCFQESFSPKLPKDNTKRLTLVHRLSWARYP